MKKFGIAFALPLVLTINTPAKAQDAGVHGTIVAGAAVVPEYEGAGKQKVVPLVIGRLADGNRYLSFEGPTVRANVVDSKWIEFGPLLSVTPRRGSGIKTPAVARLGAIKDAVEVGAFAAISHSVSNTDRIRFAIQGAQDISGVHKGWLGSANASYVAEISPKLSFSSELSVTYASSDYAGKYFTVTPVGATSSGLPVFKAKAGIKDVSTSFNVFYNFDKKWSLFGIAAYKKLVGSVAASPIVKIAGKSDQFVGGIGVGYSF